MNKRTIAFLFLLGVLLLCIAALTWGGTISDGHATETAQFATEWHEDVVSPIQTERAAQ